MAEQEYDRLSLAQEQLETAISLFIDAKNYTCAITLAGAAEEVFGKELTRRGGKCTLEIWYDSIAETHRLLHNAELVKTSFIDGENRARNALKHLESAKGPTITLDLEECACWMLVRALQNGKGVGVVFDREGEFEEWFWANVVGE